METTTFWDRVQLLLDKRGMTSLRLSQLVGLSQGAMTNYKNGTYPKVDIAVKMANELGVTCEYLVTGNDSKVREVNTIPKDIETLIQRIDKLDSKKRSFLLDSIRHQLNFIDSVSYPNEIRDTKYDTTNIK